MKDNIKKPLSEDDLEEISGGKGKVFLPITISAVSFFQGPFSQSMTYAMSPSNIVVQNENKSSQTQISSETKESLLREFTSIHETLKWKLIMDGRFHYANNPLACDEGRAGANCEPRYKNSMINALKYTFDDNCMTKKLDADLYLDLHKKAINGVSPQGAEFEYWATYNVANFRTAHKSNPLEQVGFSLEMGINFSEKGKKQYGKKGQNSLWQSDQLFKVNNDDFSPGGILVGIMVLGEEIPLSRFFPPDPLTDESIKKAVNLIFEEYYSKLSELKEKGVVEGTLISENASTEDKKLEIIIRICQNLDQLHAFRDGNIRTIVFLVMQRMPMENGLSPTIFDDPNCIDLKSVEEIMQELKEGQETYKKIVKESNQIKQKEST